MERWSDYLKGRAVAVVAAGRASAIQHAPIGVRINWASELMFVTHGRETDSRFSTHGHGSGAERSVGVRLLLLAKVGAGGGREVGGLPG